MYSVVGALSLARGIKSSEYGKTTLNEKTIILTVAWRKMG